MTFDGGIETIPRGLFEHVGMERVTIPDTVRTIEYCAFWGCDKLRSVKLGDGVEVIEAEAFQDCTALAGDLMLPESLRYIGDGAFAGCASIQAVNIPVGLATDEYCGCDSGHRGPFWGCSGIRDVSFDAGTTVVPNGLFYGCDGIESLTIPDTVASIGDNAFYRMTSLGSIKLPNGLVHLGSYALGENADGLSIVFQSAPPELAEDALEDNVGWTAYVPSDQWDAYFEWREAYPSIKWLGGDDEGARRLKIPWRTSCRGPLRPTARSWPRRCPASHARRTARAARGR